MPPRNPSRRPATTIAELAILPSAGELPVEVASAAALPEWIKVAPAGPLNCRDGRTYTLDPARLAARFVTDRVDIPVDLGHATVADPTAPALGWINELQARPDGLHGHVKEWLAGGQAVLAARTHRYVSPAFHHDDKGAATWLHSVALVAAPALAEPAVLSAGGAGAGEGDIIVALGAALGLPAGATRVACLGKVAELATTAVPLAVHQAVLTTLDAARAELATVKASHRREGIDTLLDDALKALKITPAERAHYAELCATDAGLDTVKRLLGSKVALEALRPSVLERRPVPRERESRRSAEQLAAAATALMTERKAKGLPTITYADAMTRVVRDMAAG